MIQPKTKYSTAYIIYISVYCCEKVFGFKSLMCDYVNSLAPVTCGNNLELVIFKFIWWIDIFPGNRSHVNATRLRWWLVNTGSGNGLVPSGNKTLPEPILTRSYVALCSHWATMSLSCTWLKHTLPDWLPLFRHRGDLPHNCLRMILTYKVAIRP